MKIRNGRKLSGKWDEIAKKYISDRIENLQVMTSREHSILHNKVRIRKR